MTCPHCRNKTQQTQPALSPDAETNDVLFELCPMCGMIWLDFGASRPGLYRSVEAQVARWEQARLRRESQHLTREVS